MPKYNVTVEETIRLYVTVDAEDEDDARSLAIEAIIHQGEEAAYDVNVEDRRALWAVKSSI